MVEAAENIITSKNSSAARLAEAVHWSDIAMQPFRDTRKIFIAEYAGPYYGNNISKRRPLNLLYSIISTLVPTVVLDPRANIKTNDVSLRPFAEIFAKRIDKVLDRINFGDIVKAVCVDALFSMGIFKTSMAPGEGGQADDGDIDTDPGQIYSDRVSMDDYVPDHTARERSEMAYEGNRYTVPFDWAMDSGLYDKRALDDAYMYRGEWARGSQTADIAHGGTRKTESQEYIKRIELLDIWLPGENVIVTLPADPNVSVGYLAERDYSGPAGGPYDVLGFAGVPDNITPLGLISVIYDLYEHINTQASKIARQSERAKDIGIGMRGNSEDADAARTAKDGDFVLLTDPASVKTLSIGGATEKGYQACAWFNDYLNKISGNIDLIGGLKSQANTLGQDQLNMQNASIRVSEWRSDVLKVVDRVLEKIGWYVWNDTHTTENYELKAGGEFFNVTWPAELREGSFEEYGLAINPYTRSTGDGDQDYAKLRQWSADFGPMVNNPATGTMLDGAKIAADAARLQDIENADEYIITADEMFLNQQQQQLPQSRPGGGPGVNKTTVNLGNRRTGPLRQQQPQPQPASPPTTEQSNADNV